VPVSESVQPYTQFNNGNIKVYQWTEYWAIFFPFICSLPVFLRHIS
jgi:hypothetical protein